MAKTNIWYWGSPMPITVSGRGVIDDNAQLAFTRGQCHALAVAIHERTGWQIVGICAEGDSPDSPGHMAVLTPDGQTVDIGGPGAHERWESRWGTCTLTCTLVDFTSEDALKPNGYLAADVAVARPFVPKVLRLAGYDPRKVKRMTKVMALQEAKQLPLAFAAGAVEWRHHVSKNKSRS